MDAGALGKWAVQTMGSVVEHSSSVFEVSTDAMKPLTVQETTAPSEAASTTREAGFSPVRKVKEAGAVAPEKTKSFWGSATCCGPWLL